MAPLFQPDHMPPRPMLQQTPPPGPANPSWLDSQRIKLERCNILTPGPVVAKMDFDPTPGRLNKTLVYQGSDGTCYHFKTLTGAALTAGFSLAAAVAGCHDPACVLDPADPLIGVNCSVNYTVDITGWIGDGTTGTAGQYYPTLYPFCPIYCARAGPGPDWTNAAYGAIPPGCMLIEIYRHLSTWFYHDTGGFQQYNPEPSLSMWFPCPLGLYTGQCTDGAAVLHDTTVTILPAP